MIKRKYLEVKDKMAAKLCANCGGGGEVLVTSLKMGIWDGFDIVSPSSWITCRDCNGLGYIPLEKTK